MPVSSNFSMEPYSSGRESRGRRSSESSTASDATRELSGDATENIPTRRIGVGPKPAANPMKFVSAGPVPLLRTASEQMLKAEKLRLAAKPAVKEEESAAWQNNLDSWKSNRRKRQEDVIERLTEVKKLEEQESGRGAARRNKTFGEMMQERTGDRRSRRVLQVFTDDDNDISSLLSAKSPASSDSKSDLGFATSSDTGSEPSDHQETLLDKNGAVSSPAAADSNGHDSGTEEYTYDSAIQGYMKFAEKSRGGRSAEPAPAPADGRGLSVDSSLQHRQASPQPSSPAEETRTAEQPAPAPVKTGRPSVVLRDKKAKVDVLKRRSMFEERTAADEERRVSAAQRRIHRKSADLSDGLRHRIASLETVAGVGDDAPWKPPVKGDKFLQKLAMFSSMEHSREATADRRCVDPIPRQKSASDLRSKFEQLAAEEAAALERRPSGPHSLERRHTGSSTLERWQSGPSSLEHKEKASSSLERRKSASSSLERRKSGSGSLERRPNGTSSSGAREAPYWSASSGRRCETSSTERVERHTTEARQRSSAETFESEVVERAARGSAPVPQPAAAEATLAVATVKRYVDDYTGSSTNHRADTASVTSPGSEVTSPQTARAAPVPMDINISSSASLQQKPCTSSALLAPAPCTAPAPFTTPEPRVPAPATSLAEAPAEDRVEAPAETPEYVQESNPAEAQDQIPAEVRPATPEKSAVVERAFSAEPSVPATEGPTWQDLPATQGPAWQDPPATEGLTWQDPQATQGLTWQDPPATESLSWQDPPATESLPWQDPAEVADQMEAQILRQLEESERTQMSAMEPPLVLEFPLQPSRAAPPSEKPPPPPPAGSDDEEPEMRPVKSTTTVKKDLYRRRSDFLGIQGQPEPEPVTTVARPPDMESLLRQERALQQQERRRQQQQQSREESLRKAEEEAEVRAEEFRRRAVVEKEQREKERRAVEEQLEQQERERRQQEQEQRQEQQRLQQERRAQEQEMERRAQEQHLMDQERLAQEQHLMDQERQAQEQHLLDQERRAQEQARQQEEEQQQQQQQQQQEVLWGDAELQEREWRRRKEQLSVDEDVDRQEREIMESLEREESWRHQQHAKYQSRLARMAATEKCWQRTQEAPAGPSASADLLSSRQQARSNPNLLEDPAASLLASSRSYGDLAAPAAVPLQQSRSHGRLYQPPPPAHHHQPQQRHPAGQPSQQQQPAPTKPQRTAEQEARIPWTAQALAQKPPPSASPPGPMSRNTLNALAAAPRPNLRQEWVPRKRADAPRNTGQHWLIQEAEQRRISAQQERSSRQQQMGGYPTARAPPQQQPQLTQNSAPPSQQQFAQPPAGALMAPPQHPAYYTQQPIYENTPAQLLNAKNNYQDAGRGNYGTQVYHSPELSPPAGHLPTVAPSGQSGEDRVLSVSGRKKCSHCGEELGRGAAMIIESLRLFYHITCFKCCVCNVQLGNGSMGADVRVRNNKLHCHDCYSNDEGLKFSKV